MTDLSVGEAAVARDALCRTLYSRLFTWIVARINDAVKVSTQMSSQPIFCNRNPTYRVEVFLMSPAKFYIPSNTLFVKMFGMGGLFMNFKSAGLKEGGLPLPPAFQYLLLMI